MTVTVVVGAEWLLPPGVPGVPGAPGAPGAPGIDVGCAVVVVECVVVCVDVGVEDVVGDGLQPHSCPGFTPRAAVAVAEAAAVASMGLGPRRARRLKWAVAVAAAAPPTKMSCRKRRSTLFEAGWSNWAAGRAPMRGRAAAKIRETTDTETFIVD